MIAAEWLVFTVCIVSAFIIFTVLAVNLIAYSQKKGWLKPNGHK